MTFSPGLKDIVAAETRLSSVDGEAGELVLAGYPLEEIAERATFEEMAYLIWHGSLPDAAALDQFTRELAGRRTLPVANGQAAPQHAGRSHRRERTFCIVYRQNTSKH